MVHTGSSAAGDSVGSYARPFSAGATRSCAYASASALSFTRPASAGCNVTAVGSTVSKNYLRSTKSQMYGSVPTPAMSSLKFSRHSPKYEPFEKSVNYNYNNSLVSFSSVHTKYSLFQIIISLKITF